MDRNDPKTTEFLEKHKRKVDHLFRKPISKFLGLEDPMKKSKCDMINFWEGRDKEKSSKWPGLVRDARNCFHGSMRETGMNVNADSHPSLILYGQVRYVRTRKPGKKCRSYGHDIIRPGNVVQVMLSTPLSRILSVPVTSLPSSRYYFFVLCISGYENSRTSYAIVRRLDVCGNSVETESIYQVSDEATQFLRMVENVMRAGMLHVCGTSCKVNPSSSSVRHNGDENSGEKYVLLGRNFGYPPHMG